MKARICTLLLGLTALGAQAQNYCGTVITKSGTGLTRTYTSSHPNAPGTITWTQTWNTYPGTYPSSTAASVTRTYTYGGYYRTGISAYSSSSCLDSATVVDTVIGPMDCSTAYVYLTASGTGLSRTFNTNTYVTNPAPGYTASGITYDYGDGTNGTSNMHTYAAAGTYVVTATSVWSSGGTYPSCTKTATTTVNATSGGTAFNCATAHAAFTQSHSGATYTFLNTTTPSTLPTGTTVYYTWNFGNGSTASGPGTQVVTYTANGTYTVKLKAVWYSNGALACTDSSIASVTVTGVTPPPNPTNQITGGVSWDSMLTMNYNAVVKFWLIQYDSTTQMLTAVDSTTYSVNGLPGGFAPYTFSNKPAGSYRLKAHVTNQPASATIGLLPTYADSSVYWSNAVVINHTGVTTYKYWQLKTGAPVPGNGFVSGSVLQGANKGTASGDPVVGQLVIARDGSGKAVGSGVTNAQGQYTITNLPGGLYTIYPEELNYTTTPSSSFVITGFQNTKADVNFRKNSNARTIVPAGAGTTGIAAVDPAAGFVLTPNPSSGRVVLTMPAAAGTYSVTVTAMTGQVVYQLPAQVASKSGVQELELSHLVPGVYNVAIQSAKGTEHQALLIQR